ncbi:MAG: hypothetical protein CHACPFDD_03526 [Phycisphaerae bacterium]|nr:hypothetical protein [Phycisphaerae bacterium]
MIHFCIFGGHEGMVSSDNRFYVTIFGGSELRVPTVARQIIEARRGERSEKPSRRCIFITIFGGTSLRAPTLAEEYLELNDALRSGAITLSDWDLAVGRLGARQSIRYGSFTFCGGFEGNELPSEEEELDGLALNQHLGQIPESIGKLLMLGVGQKGVSRPAIVRQAIASARTHAA